VTYALENYGDSSGGGDTTPAPTTGKIYGYVTDAETGDPIEGATVTVGSVATATTDAQGYYEVEVEAGTYTVTVTADGYESASTTVTVEAGGSVQVDFQLNPVQQGGGPKVAVIGDVYGEIVKLLENVGATVVSYTSVPEFMASPDPDVVVVVVDHWDASDVDDVPAADDVVAFLSFLDQNDIGLVALDGGYEGDGTFGNILYLYNAEIEAAGYPAPDARAEDYTTDSRVAVYVPDASHPLFTNIDGSYYLADTSQSSYADYVVVDFTDDSGVSVVGYIAVRGWLGWYVEGATIAVWDAPGAESWVFIFQGSDGYWMRYNTPGADGLYSLEHHQLLVNAVAYASP